ncbi:MAG TPA: acyl-CoA thioesterase [Anaerolineales bacterium]|nr:acyl-CoA thioesterase [Anaerolineales bacterium]
MEHSHTPKPMRLSHIQLAQMMQPEHANSQGNVHGGWIMKLVDEAGALASTRHASHRTVTVAMDQMFFHHPIHIGDLVIFNADVTYAGHTSMEVEVQVLAENPMTGERIQTNTAFLVYVAIDDHGKPTQVPPLLAETPEEQARIEAAKARQKQRLALRGK